MDSLQLVKLTLSLCKVAAPGLSSKHRPMIYKDNYSFAYTIITQKIIIREQKNNMRKKKKKKQNKKRG